MSEEQKNDNISQEEENALRRTAQHRTTFKIHLGIFVLVNIFLWIVWYFLFKGKEDPTFFKAILFLSVAWFVFVVAHYLIVYKWDKTFSEKELSRLKKQRRKQLAQIEKLRLEIKNREEHQKQQTNNHQE